MKLTQKKIDDYTIELTVTEDAAAFSKEIKRTTKALGERVNIPGFRKGKVPLPLIERHVGRETIIDEATEALLQRTTREALRTLNLIPVSENKADIVTNEEGKDFVFTLTFTPFPQVKLGEYKGLDAEKVVELVTDEDIDKQVEALRGHHANLIEAAEGDAIVDGDFITLDYTGTINGEKFAGGEAKDQPLEIGSHKFIGDFEEQLIGAKVGEERTVKVTFPDEYHAKDLAGREAEFACKINSIKHRELPELNDAFIEKFTTFKTLDEYKADVRKNMETNADRRAVEAQRQAVIDKAVDNMTIDLPPVMVENRIDQMINDLAAQLQTQGMKLEQYMAFSGTDMDKLREDYREAAKKNVLTDIMLEQVAEAEKLSVEPAELNYEISMMAQMYRTPVKQVAKFLQENGQLINIASTIRRRKAVKFILDNMASAKDEAATVESVKPATEAQKPAQPAATAKPAKPATEAPKPAQPAPTAQPAKPATEAPKPAQPAATAKPAKPATEAPKPAQPTATAQPVKPATEAQKPAQPSATAQPVKPATEAPKPAQPAATAQPAKPATEAPKPAQPTATAQPVKPATEAQKPAQPSATAQPVKPATEAPKPAQPAATAQPVKLATEAPKPAQPAATVQPAKPATEAPKPAQPAATAQPVKPATEAPKPAQPAAMAQPVKPATEAPKPAQPAPTAQPAKPATEAPKPAQPAATAQPAKPATEAPKPAQPAPTAQPVKPVAEAQKPAQPAPTAQPAKPATEAPKPAQPAPTAQPVKPVAEAPKPAQPAATAQPVKPATEAPKPVQPAATAQPVKPATEAPKPAQPAATAQPVKPATEAPKPAQPAATAQPVKPAADNTEK